MTGKRLMPRLAKSLPVRIFGISPTWTNATTVDVAPAGIGLRVGADLRDLREYRIEVELPGTTIELQADVVWCYEGPAQQWRCGLKLVAAPERWFQMWVKWMEESPCT